MQWVVLNLLISLGTVSYQGLYYSPGNYAVYATDAGTLQETIGAEVVFKGILFAGASVQTWDIYNGRLFSPLESFYVFNAGVRWNGVEVGWRHECDHLTLAGMSMPSQGFGSERNDVYVTYKTSINLF